MQITDTTYRQHCVFAELQRYMEFYGQFAMSVFSFATMDEAVGAIETIESEYERHCAAAREIAFEHFDAPKVLGRLLDEVYAAR